MGDFHQHGVVTTLHQLNQRPFEQLEADLVEFGKSRPMALILPSLYSEFQGPALSLIVDELCDVPYLNQIVVGLDVPARTSIGTPSTSSADSRNARKFCGMTARVSGVSTRSCENTVWHQKNPARAAMSGTCSDTSSPQTERPPWPFMIATSRHTNATCWPD